MVCKLWACTQSHECLDSAFSRQAQSLDLMHPQKSHSQMALRHRTASRAHPNDVHKSLKFQSHLLDLLLSALPCWPIQMRCSDRRFPRCSQPLFLGNRMGSLMELCLLGPSRRALANVSVSPPM